MLILLQVQDAPVVEYFCFIANLQSILQRIWTISKRYVMFSLRDRYRPLAVLWDSSTIFWASEVFWLCSLQSSCIIVFPYGLLVTFNAAVLIFDWVFTYGYIFLLTSFTYGMPSSFVRCLIWDVPGSIYQVLRRVSDVEGLKTICVWRFAAKPHSSIPFVQTGVSIDL